MWAFKSTWFKILNASNLHVCIHKMWKSIPPCRYHVWCSIGPKQFFWTIPKDAYLQFQRWELVFCPFRIGKRLGILLLRSIFEQSTAVARAVSDLPHRVSTVAAKKRDTCSIFSWFVACRISGMRVSGKRSRRFFSHSPFKNSICHAPSRFKSYVSCVKWLRWARIFLLMTGNCFGAHDCETKANQEQRGSDKYRFRHFFNSFEIPRERLCNCSNQNLA